MSWHSNLSPDWIFGIQEGKNSHFLAFFYQLLVREIAITLTHAKTHASIWFSIIYVAFSWITHNAQIDVLSDLRGKKTIALGLRSLLIVPLNSWRDIWSLRAWMYYLYIHSLIGSIAHTDLIQRNWAVISTQARDYLPLLLLYNAKLPLNLAIKSPRYAFS